jgi:predicted ATPase
MSVDIEFAIVGLNGRSNVELKIGWPSTIFVGPNGSGKSTAISIFYLAITEQWDRLSAGYNFEGISLRTANGSGELTRVQIEALAATRDRSFISVDRLERYALRLGGPAGLNDFLTAQLNHDSEVQRFTRLLGVPRSEVPRLQAVLRPGIGPAPEDVAAHRKFSEALRDRVLFLPTYRRIEQDLKKISPELFESFSRFREQAPTFARRRERFHEIIEFGMADVHSLWKTESSDIREFSRTRLNALSSDYLRTVIRGQTDLFTLPDLTDARISEVLARADVAALTAEDKTRLSEKMASLRSTSNISTDDTYLARYFALLVGVVQQIETRESQLKNLSTLLTRYLGPQKIVSYDTNTCEISISQDDTIIDLAQLSSGEKQIVSTFSYLYLGGGKSYMVIIDEPELSLSVIWQERFLEDVTKAPLFKGLIAVTHSPFVYDNSLSGSVVDFTTCLVPYAGATH